MLLSCKTNGKYLIGGSPYGLLPFFASYAPLYRLLVAKRYSGIRRGAKAACRAS